LFLCSQYIAEISIFSVTKRTDQSCFLIGRNSKISEITCLMELLHNWNVRYLDLQNICVFLFAKIPRWPPPQDKFNTWPYGKHISKSLLSETTEHIKLKENKFVSVFPIYCWNLNFQCNEEKYLMYENAIQSINRESMFIMLS
jgi:hypothetical protein